MHYEVDVGYLGQFVDVKVYDEGLMHHFQIGPEGIDYEIINGLRYDLTAGPSAELQEMRDEKRFYQLKRNN